MNITSPLWMQFNSPTTSASNGVATSTFVYTPLRHTLTYLSPNSSMNDWFLLVVNSNNLTGLSLYLAYPINCEPCLRATAPYGLMTAFSASSNALLYCSRSNRLDTSGDTSPVVNATCPIYIGCILPTPCLDIVRNIRHI